MKPNKTFDWNQARVTIVGLGKSGQTAARFCATRGAQVTVVDDKPVDALSPALAALDPFPITYHLGGIAAAPLLQASLVVVSPGIPWNHSALQRARLAGISVMGELEFAAQWIQAPLVGITGTNGKSTVTSLCGAIAAETGRPFFCGGNLGTPLLEAVDTPAAEKQGVVVCEMSSFQLEDAKTLHCQAAAFLNLTPDHLDRHLSLERYGDAKANIANNQTSQDVLVVNADDEAVLDAVSRNHPHRQMLGFSLRAKTDFVNHPRLTYAGWVENQQLVIQCPHQPEERYAVVELQLAGRHNWANAMAACLLMRASGLASYEQTRRALATFRALPHRMEFVTEYQGISYYDDSKGTNVDAVVASLDGFPKPFALIAGGRDKGGSYAPLGKVLASNTVRGVVLIGEAAPLIAAVVPSHIPTVRAKTMEEAVSQATHLCRNGDAVVLSPACSSFDMFRGYDHRAEVFRQAIATLSHAGVRS